MVAPGQPLEGLKIFIQIIMQLPLLLPLWPCRIWVTHWQVATIYLRLFIFLLLEQSREGRPENWTGVIIVQPATLSDNLSSVSNSLSVGYCDRNQRLVWVSSPVSF